MNEITVSSALASNLTQIGAVPMLNSIEIGSVTIPTYPLMIGFGAIAMLIYTLYYRKKYGLSVLKCFLFTVCLTVCGIAGAKILYILEHLPDVMQNGISGMGVSFFGSVYLIPVMMPVVGALCGMKTVRTNDLCAPCVALMIGFIRIGCLLNGCCGGWVMYVGNYYFSWPTQILEGIGDFLIFYLLFRIEDRGHIPGTLYPIFMICYSVLRFFVEFLRYSSNKWLIFSNGHGFALAAIIVAFVWIRVCEKHNARKKHNR